MLQMRCKFMGRKPKAMERDPVGQAILDARLKARLTQGEVASELHVKAQQIARWEKTGRIRDHQKFTELAKLLKTSVSELMGLPDNEAFQIRNQGMQQFVREIDKGIAHLSDEEIRKIADFVNAFIESKVKSQKRKKKAPLNGHR